MYHFFLFYLFVVSRVLTYQGEHKRFDAKLRHFFVSIIMELLTIDE